MLALLRPVLLCALAAASAFAQADWTTATELPLVDMKGLTPAQTKQVLDILREESCTCGCGMKVAECRIMDPKCGDSRALSYIVVEGVRNRRTAPQIHDDLIHSPIATQRARQNRILGDPVNIPVSGSPSRGPANARITLVEFSDFECPYCSAAVPEIDEVLKAYPHDARLVYKQFPLDMHPHAMMAAEASLAAQAQGKFWEMYEKLFSYRGHLSPEKIFTAGKEIGLDMVRFTHDLQSHAFAKQIEQDLVDGQRAGVFGTPSVFINGKLYRGSLELPAVAPVMKNELNGTQSASR